MILGVIGKQARALFFCGGYKELWQAQRFAALHSMIYLWSNKI